MVGMRTTPGWIGYESRDAGAFEECEVVTLMTSNHTAFQNARW